ncbi:uncharacterized protein AMSG_11857 [Thecamonas trahens ATCC 50062]|uniref:Uncharacterized protein n=1 Tax=Thecamonas trahens ATCC 50062 TaxID=461836 RepID=A0A0L0DCZ0_THETB|nr:hypothetical protein AMSG_11857 [Thecamonas trahens ATCC 50062]KNC49193.1 hypothetical protein AMSG_11857 [Thecamonas trahens ATCC 50062]|eukprot:XP_013758236.1 hypothetical protein AMSG_11857 [Thecamonas trahens ATCC 50062]
MDILLETWMDPVLDAVYVALGVVLVLRLGGWLGRLWALDREARRSAGPRLHPWHRRVVGRRDSVCAGDDDGAGDDASSGDDFAEGADQLWLAECDDDSFADSDADSDAECDDDNFAAHWLAKIASWDEHAGGKR